MTKIKCVGCSNNINKTDKLIGLMPRGQIIDLKYINGLFYSNDDIKFEWNKDNWKGSKVGCYGCIIHNDCWNKLNNTLKIKLTFEDILMLNNICIRMFLFRFMEIENMTVQSFR